MQRSTGRPAVQLPEPSRLWIRYAPRHWPPPSRPWLDVSSGQLGRTAEAAGEADPLAYAFAPEPAYDDTVYLPPVPEGRAAERAALAGDLALAGTPVLIHVLSEEEQLPPARGLTVAMDLLPVFLGEEPWPAPREGGGAVWPLLPGISQGSAHWRDGLPRLTGFAWVQGMEVQLSGGDRRLLLERAGEGIFDALYHPRETAAGETERAFAAAAAAHGLLPFPPRPLPQARPAGANRRLAAALLLAGELWTRLGRSPAQGQAYYRAARFVDGTTYDVTALAEEGNLGVVPALDEASLRLILDQVRTGNSPDLAALQAEYLAFPWEDRE